MGNALGYIWPLILIVPAGLQLLMARRLVIGPLLVLALGIVFLIDQADVLSVSIWAIFWPLVLIAIGAWVVMARGTAPRIGGTGIFSGAHVNTTEESVNTFALFGSSEVVDQSPSFEKAELMSVFGGCTLDLRGAQLDPAGADVTVTSIFGGSDVLVPEGWQVVSDGMGIFGGFDNKVPAVVPATAGAPHLTVRGLALFGGVGIKTKK
jgi:predicted membrane protein